MMSEMAGDPSDNAEKSMTLGEHLEELRRRILYALAGLAMAMVVTMIFGRQILTVLQYPYQVVTRDLGLPSALTVPTIGTGTEMYLRVSFYAGLILAAPWIFYQLWMFVSAGLYHNERRYVVLAVPFSAALFIAGAMFFLFVASIPSIRFLVAVNKWLGYQSIIMVRDYIEFMTNLMLIFGLAFQTPLAVLLLAKMGLVSLQGLKRYRRHVVLCIAVVAAMVTPSPSPVDMIVLALPMWLLYELSVLLTYLSQKREAARPRES